MQEKLTPQHDDFQPLASTYGAYPIPAVLESIGEVSRPIDLIVGSDYVIDQIVRASVDKPVTASNSPRMENHIPLITPHDVLIERSSHERKIKGNPEVSRKITDVIEFAGLGGANQAYDRTRLTVYRLEIRGGKDIERDIETDSWRLYFYKPGETQPAAEVFKADMAPESYIKVEKDRYSYDISESGSSEHAKPIEMLKQDHPGILDQLASTIQEMQFSILEPMQPAINNREIVIRRSAGLGFRDPHTRRIGRLARLADRIMELRDK